MQVDSEFKPWPNTNNQTLKVMKHLGGIPYTAHGAQIIPPPYFYLFFVVMLILGRLG